MKYQKEIKDIYTEYKIVEKNKIEVEKEIEEKTKYLENLNKVNEIIINFSENIQKEIMDKIQYLVSFFLKTIYGEEYDFIIKNENKRDQLEIKFYLKINDFEREIKNRTIAGGIKSIISFGLRLAIHSVTQPNTPVILMDEPFTELGDYHLQKMLETLKLIPEMLNIQLIIITHLKELLEIADNKIIIE